MKLDWGAINDAAMIHLGGRKIMFSGFWPDQDWPDRLFVASILRGRSSRTVYVQPDRMPMDDLLPGILRKLDRAADTLPEPELERIEPCERRA